MIIADETSNPAFVAADLLAQAEHGTGKEKVYVSVPNKDFLAQLEQAIKDLLPNYSHAEAIKAVLKKGSQRSFPKRSKTLSKRQIS